MLLGAVFAKHIGEAHQTLARSIPDDNLWILEGALEVWPELLEVRLDEKGDAFDGDTESHDGALAHVGVV